MAHWENLLSLRKHGDEEQRKRIKETEIRLGFEVDYDRILYSSDFRSLQSKTQVFPLSHTDFVHTRLTHSLEVSVVGRSIGRIVGQKIIEKYPYLNKDFGHHFYDFGAILAAATLAHDIGNPPFGHGGEKAIGTYFSTGNGRWVSEHLNKKEFQDLVDFEGNANGFKILTESKIGTPGGLRLTYATLGAFLKYPKESLPQRKNPTVSQKKFSFFQAQKDDFIALVDNLGLKPKGSQNPEDLLYQRHPLAFLVEAADDICYSIIDFEDGINLGLIDEHIGIELLHDLVKSKINNDKFKALVSKSDKVAYLRALSINILIEEVCEIFLKYEEKLCKGEFEHSLISKSHYIGIIDNVLEISKQKLYLCDEVVEKEIAGHNILNRLLNVFITSYSNTFYKKANTYDKWVLRLVPEKYLDYTNLYLGLLNICGFIAGLSDKRVINLNNKTSGISL